VVVDKKYPELQDEAPDEVQVAVLEAHAVHEVLVDNGR
jgi:hypothetical protein